MKELVTGFPCDCCDNLEIVFLQLTCSPINSHKDSINIRQPILRVTYVDHTDNYAFT